MYAAGPKDLPYGIRRGNVLILSRLPKFSTELRNAPKDSSVDWWRDPN
jgi:hypothetical protein